MSVPPRKLCPKCNATLTRSKMLTVPSGTPGVDPLMSHGALPKAPTRPGFWLKCRATVARSTMLMTMSGDGSGPVSEGPDVHAVQYQLTFPARWNFFHPPERSVKYLGADAT